MTSEPYSSNNMETSIKRALPESHLGNGITVGEHSCGIAGPDATDRPDTTGAFSGFGGIRVRIAGTGPGVDESGRVCAANGMNPLDGPQNNGYQRGVGLSVHQQVVDGQIASQMQIQHRSAGTTVVGTGTLARNNMHADTLVEGSTHNNGPILYGSGPQVTPLGQSGTTGNMVGGQPSRSMNPYEALATAGSATGPASNPYSTHARSTVRLGNEQPSTAQNATSFAPLNGGQFFNGDQTLSSGQPFRNSFPFMEGPQFKSNQSFNAGQPFSGNQAFPHDKLFSGSQPLSGRHPPERGPQINSIQQTPPHAVFAQFRSAPEAATLETANLSASSNLHPPQGATLPNHAPVNAISQRNQGISSCGPDPFLQPFGAGQGMMPMDGTGPLATPNCPPCACGQPSIQLTVRKEGPNTGRMFYKCGRPQGEQCNYFQWADEPIKVAAPGGNGSGPTSIVGPPCTCGQPSIQLTVRKEGPNTGRLFYACSRPQGERCNYFQWADEPAPAGVPGGSGVSGQVASGGPMQDVVPGGNLKGPTSVVGPPCGCGQPSIQLTVRKEGPNTGRLFYACSRPQGERCNYFQWADEPPPVAMPGGSSVTGQAAACGPPCPCGQPSLQLTVRKEGPNMGRIFYKCARPQGEQCNYFQWADEPVRAVASSNNVSNSTAIGGPPCACGQPSIQLTVRKEGPNTGRLFYKCSRPQGQNCDFFQWADEPVATPARASTGDRGSTGRGRSRAGRARGRGKRQEEDTMGGYGAAFDDFSLTDPFTNDRFQPF